MAAAIKALNAKIRSNKYTDYFCSTRMYTHAFTHVSLGIAHWKSLRGRHGEDNLSGGYNEGVVEREEK
jgi:hypothetical protein